MRSFNKIYEINIILLKNSLQYENNTILLEDILLVWTLLENLSKVEKKTRTLHYFF